MHYYRVVLKCGHTGPKKSYEVVRYMEAMDLAHLLETIKKMPRIKHRNNPLKSLISVEPASREDFFLHKERMKRDPYLSRRSRSI